MRNRFTILIIFILAACSPSPLSAPDPTNVTLPTPILGELQPTHELPSKVPTILRGEPVLTPLSNDLALLIDAAKKDLAQRLEITSDETEVVSIEKTEWPDTSLGCAKPGLILRFVSIPGYRIVLSANGRNYIYHTDSESRIIFCPKG